ncbi:Mad3/BUB1 homology region 1-domain-containing protein [Mucidula mucida]|nr:Mad3/BUB1 homology region 1-domain-containing protein [Mucidula mucida]
MSEECSSPIVDADLLEAAKENVQPLATGRRVTALSSILATPHAHRESKLASTRNRLRINVDLAMEDEDEDPLEAYCCLVNWTIENYPQGHSAESGLLELLEEATRVLKDHRDRKWRAEPKYLKLWLLYASYVEKPTVIYRFLIANDIGTDLSLLYEEYSAVLERDGRRQEADKVYKLGIARRADPLDHLKARHADFEKRMMCATPVTLPESASPSTSRRPATLATTVNRSAAVPLAPATATPRSNAPVQVFVDPSGAESAMERNAWPDLGTRKTRIKENVPQTKKMAGSTLKQSKRTASSSSTSASRIVPFMDPPQPSASRIVPFADEEPTVPATPKFTPFRDESVSVTSPVAHAPDSVMKVKGVDVASYAEAEALRKDPLKNYGTEGLGFDDTLP